MRQPGLRKLTRRGFAWLALAGAAAFAVFGHPDLRIDDAYITLHNARTLLAGGADPAYAGSTALTGATSAVHLVAIAGLGLWLHPVRNGDRGAALAAILAASGADYFVCLTGDPFWSTLATDLARTGKRLDALNAGEAYTVYRLVPGGRSGD